MKKTILSMLLITAAAVLSGAAVPDPPNMPRRLPRVKQIGSKALLSLTKANTAVVIAPDAGSVTRFAAQEQYL